MAAAISASDALVLDVAERRANATVIGRRLCELAAHTHAAMAELSSLAQQFNQLDGWCGDGVRSFADWLTINAGFAPRTGDELLRVGEALQTLPQIRAAFATGTLSFDSVRELTTVATADDEHLWLNVATCASGAQLARICRACRRVLDLDTQRHADDLLSRRGVWAHYEDDGMLSLRALLLPEEGALVQAAIEAAVRTCDRERGAAQREAAQGGDFDGSSGQQGAEADPSNAELTAASVDGELAGEPDVVPDPAGEPFAARRVDALVALCEHALAREGGWLLSDPASLPMLVHVDVGVLAGGDPDGRRHIDGGPVLSLATIRRLGCDASLIAITERDGVPINVGRRRRILPRPLRRAVQGRDRTCRFPGCAVPAQRSHAHHIEHWADGGQTDVDNLVSLCHFHHRRVHDGAFRITGDPSTGLMFETADGRVIAHRLPPVGATTSRVEALRDVCAGTKAVTIDADTPGTNDGSGRMDLGYVVSVMLDGVQRARAPAGG